MKSLSTFVFVLFAVASYLGASESVCYGEDQKDMWRSWAVTKGKETLLVVEGIYHFGGPGTVALLEPSVPQGTNHTILMLDMKLKQLPGVWPAIAIPIPAQYKKTPYGGEYKSILIRYPNGHFEEIKTITLANEEVAKESDDEKSESRIFKGESKEGDFQQALDAALTDLDKSLPEDGVADAMATWTLQNVTGVRGGIATFTTLEVTIEATRMPPWTKKKD